MDETAAEAEAKAKADAKALTDLIGGGLIVAAPLGLEESLFECLDQGLHEALADPAFQAAAATANRSLDVARADVARGDLQAVTEQAEEFIPIVREAIKKVRR